MIYVKFNRCDSIILWIHSSLNTVRCRDNFKLKLASYEHTENNSASVTANAEEKVEKGLDPLGRGQMYQAVPIDDTYPEYILNNQDKYSKLIKPWK